MAALTTANPAFVNRRPPSFVLDGNHAAIARRARSPLARRACAGAREIGFTVALRMSLSAWWPVFSFPIPR